MVTIYMHGMLFTTLPLGDPRPFIFAAAVRRLAHPEND